MTVSELEKDAYTKKIEGFSTPGKLFKDFFKSTNILTPEIIKCGKRGVYFYELSVGTSMSGTSFFGVTILEDMSKGYYRHRHDLSASFTNRKEAESYIKEVKNYE